MSFNQLMHPRNIYRIKPDYLKLGEKYPAFKDHLTFYRDGKPKLNFNDPQALKILTISLLDNDFNLRVDLPDDRLIPAIPQRLNYVLWVEDLLNLLDLSPGEIVHGLDIGTGACSIFPLLGCTNNRTWTFTATEADPVSYQFAVNNVMANELGHRIKVIQVSSDMFLLNLPGLQFVEAHFLICNPPFFNERSLTVMSSDSSSGHDEVDAMAVSGDVVKVPSPSNASIPIEACTNGGEIEFVKKIISESLILRESVKIYTVMLGHKHSSKELSRYLADMEEVKDVVVNQFYQGRTMRWGLAWTFLDNLKLCESIKTAHSKRSQKKKNLPLTYAIPRELSTVHYSLQAIYRLIRHLLRDELEITSVDIVRESGHSIEMIIRSQRDTWSHQRRRKRMLARSGEEDDRESSKKGRSEGDEVMETDAILEMESSSSGTNNSILSEEFIADESSETSELEEQLKPGKRKPEDRDEDESIEEEAKKSRDQRQVKTITKEEEMYLLHCSLTIRRIENNSIVLEMKTKDKAKSKDATNQLLTFLKNNLH